MRSVPAAAAMLFLFVGLAACGADEAEMADTTDTMGAAMSAAPAMPDTLPAEVWAAVERANYQAQWAMWPGKGRLYSGGDPHGALLTTYLNPAANDALARKAGTMPPGAVIVKENYMPDSTLAAVTVMYKAAAGYNPSANDWYWMKRLPDGTVEAAGRVDGCISCHGAQAGNDYILTGSIRP